MHKTIREFSRLKFRIAAFAGAFLLIAGIPLTFASSAVNAYATYAWCTGIGTYEACLNAWNGGPWVMTYNSPNTNNSYFNNLATGSGSNVEIEDEGLGSWFGKCIGDAYNRSDDGYTSLDSCPTTGDAGWGTNFQEYSCIAGNGDNGYDFWNNHNDGWLEPSGNTNDSNFDMGGDIPFCFAQIGPTYLE